jgi:hypothetical protein
LDYHDFHQINLKHAMGYNTWNYTVHLSKQTCKPYNVEVINTRACPSRDFYISAATSRIHEVMINLSPPIDFLIGLIVIALTMSSYEQYYIVLGYLLENKLLDTTRVSDLPKLFYDTSQVVFEFKCFVGGKYPRTQSKAFDFKVQYVENTTRFLQSISNFVDIRNNVNNGGLRDIKHYFQYLHDQTKNFPGFGIFSLQFYLPILAHLGLLSSNALHYADAIQPANDFTGGTYTKLVDFGIHEKQFEYVLLNLCQLFGFNRRLSIGESITCEGHRKREVNDLFFKGQTLFHLFLDNNTYVVKMKPYETSLWVDVPFYIPPVQVQNSNSPSKVSTD